MYKHSSKTWKNIFKDNSKLLRTRAVQWRKENTVTRVHRPTRLDRARSLGYKAKQGTIVVRIKVGRGGMRRERPKAGRRQKHSGVVKMKADLNINFFSSSWVGCNSQSLVNNRLIYIWRTSFSDGDALVIF